MAREKRETDRERPSTEPRGEAVTDVCVNANDNPNHLEDFTRLVDVAARKRPQGDQT